MREGKGKRSRARGFTRRSSGEFELRWRTYPVIIARALDANEREVPLALILGHRAEANLVGLVVSVGQAAGVVGGVEQVDIGAHRVTILRRQPLGPSLMC